MSKREDIIRRIAALQSKTVDNGCTEQEAMAAATLAGKLLKEYDLTFSDIEIKERTNCETGTIQTGRKRAHPIQYTIMAIAKFTDCQAWTSGGNYKFFGFKEDVEMAKWLYGLIFATMAEELLKFKVSNPVSGLSGRGNGRRQSHSFQVGMASRISSRLIEIKKEQDDAAKETTGRDLVPLKNAVVVDEFAKLDLSLNRRTVRTQARDHAAYGAGVAAGARFNLNKKFSKQPAGYIS